MRFIQMPPENSDLFGNRGRYCAGVISLLALLGFTAVSQAGPIPILECTTAGIGSVPLTTDDNPSLNATIESVSSGTTSGIPYCLVKVLVPPQATNNLVSQGINIWVGLPTDGNWNGRLQSEGGSVYAGTLRVTDMTSIAKKYVSIITNSVEKVP